MWRVTGGEVDQEEMDGWSERLLDDRRLTIPEAKKCIKDRRD